MPRTARSLFVDRKNLRHVHPAYRFATRAQSVPSSVGDLPLSGRSVELVVIERRFRCDAV
jgi:transposase